MPVMDTHCFAYSPSILLGTESKAFSWGTALLCLSSSGLAGSDHTPWLLLGVYMAQMCTLRALLPSPHHKWFRDGHMTWANSFPTLPKNKALSPIYEPSPNP